MISIAREIPGKIQLCWISGHTDVHSNKEADKQAKAASGGNSSKKPKLPLFLRRPMAKSASAEKHAYHEELKESWQDKWTDLPRKARFDKIDPNFLFSKFRKVSNQLNRVQSSLLVQVCTGHILLNYHLHRICKSDTDKCPNCMEHWEDTRAHEMVEHFIFKCKAFREERRHLYRDLHTDRPKLEDILSNVSKAKALLKYITRTGRLKGFNPEILQRNTNNNKDE